jgi:hypothetical protein
MELTQERRIYENGLLKNCITEYEMNYNKHHFNFSTSSESGICHLFIERDEDRRLNNNVSNYALTLKKCMPDLNNLIEALIEVRQALNNLGY